MKVGQECEADKHPMRNTDGTIVSMWLEYRGNVLADYVENSSTLSILGHNKETKEFRFDRKITWGPLGSVIQGHR